MSGSSADVLVLVSDDEGEDSEETKIVKNPMKYVRMLRKQLAAAMEQNEALSNEQEDVMKEKRILSEQVEKLTHESSYLGDQVQILKQQLKLASSEKDHAKSLFQKKLLAANAVGNLVKSQQETDQVELGRLRQERELLQNEKIFFMEQTSKAGTIIAKLRKLSHQSKHTNSSTKSLESDLNQLRRDKKQMKKKISELTAINSKLSKKSASQIRQSNEKVVTMEMEMQHMTDNIINVQAQQLSTTVDQIDALLQDVEHLVSTPLPPSLSSPLSVATRSAAARTERSSRSSKSDKHRNEKPKNRKSKSRPLNHDPLSPADVESGSKNYAESESVSDTEEMPPLPRKKRKAKSTMEEMEEGLEAVLSSASLTDSSSSAGPVTIQRATTTERGKRKLLGKQRSTFRVERENNKNVQNRVASLPLTSVAKRTKTSNPASSSVMSQFLARTSGTSFKSRRFVAPKLKGK